MEDMTFKQAMHRLDEIVKILEKNDIELEEAMSLFEEGLHLVNSCEKQMTGFENRVQSLLDTYQDERRNENV